MNKYFNLKSIFALVIAIVLLVNLTDNFAFAAKVDRQAPTAPSNLKTTAVTDTSVTLVWDASTDNVRVNAYSIYKDNTYFESTLTTTYTVNDLKPDTTYQFYIKAKDEKRNLSKPSNTITVTTASTGGQTNTPATKKVIGYYAAWSAYSGFTPDKIDASKLTHINYAFANITSDLKITMGYPDKDPSNFKMLQSLKTINPNLKTLISLGGWTWSGKLSDAALTDASRTVFADSCVAFITQYGFDGVDIDWEYPVGGGLATNVSRPEDKQNFTLLLKKVREKLDARGLTDNKHYLLTIAGGASNYYIGNTEPAIFHQYIDYANIMTYDIHGSWDSYADFNAPLYNNSDISPQNKWSVDSSVKAWINAGFPADKLIVGVPFYGYSYDTTKSDNNGLYQAFTGAKSLSYNNIAANYLNAQGYSRYFHEQSMVPWLFNGTTFISYEDEQSMGLKADYIKTQGLGGAAIWELSQDTNKVLLNALFEGLK